jgi:non-ribosomal peptide synthetase component F
MSTIVQTAWSLVLARTGQTKDVVFGTTWSGRDADVDQIDEIMGPTIFTVPMRMRVPDRRTVIEWLGDFQAAAQEHSRHGRVSPSDIRSWSEVPRGRPLYESVVIFENYPTAPEAELRAGAELLRTKESTNFPLTLVVLPFEGDRLRWRLTFRETEFESDQVEVLNERLVRALVVAVEQCTQTVNDVIELM